MKSLLGTDVNGFVTVTAVNGFEFKVLEALLCSQLSLSHHHDFISTALTNSLLPHAAPTNSLLMMMSFI